MADEVYRVEIPIDVVDKTEPELTRIRSKVSSFERSLTSAGARMQKWGRGMSSFGRTMTRNVSMPLAAAGAAALKLYADFEKSFTDIRALVGIGGRSLEKMRTQTLNMARTMPQGPQALAEALYFVTSSGFKGASAMRVLEASAKAAAAGLGDTMTVADAVTSAVNAYGETSLSASRATDILLATVREGKAEPDALAGAIGRVIAPAEAMGVAFHEVGGALASLSLTGLDAAEATTALRGVLTTFMAPTLKTKSALKDLGYTTKGLQQAMEDDFMGAMMRLRKELGDDKVAMGEVFGNVRALNGFLALTGRNADKNVGIFKNLAGAVGDTDKAFKKASSDPMFRFQKAMSNIKTTLIEVAPTILPVAEKIVKMLEGWAKAIGRMDEDKLERIVKLLGIAMIAGPVLRLAGGLMTAGGGALKGAAGLHRLLMGGKAASTVAAGAGAGKAGGSIAGAVGKQGLLRLLGLGLGAGSGAVVGGAGLAVGGLAIAEGRHRAKRRGAEGVLDQEGMASPAGKEAMRTLQISRRDIAQYSKQIADYRKMEADQGRLTLDQERALEGLLAARRSIHEEIAKRRKDEARNTQRPIRTQLALLEAVNGKLTAQEQIRLNTMVIEGKYTKAVGFLKDRVKEANAEWLEHHKALKDVKDGWTGVDAGIDKTTRSQDRLISSLRNLKRIGTEALMSLINTYGDAETAAKALQDANNARNWGWEGGGSGGGGHTSGGKGGSKGSGSSPTPVSVGGGPVKTIAVAEGAVQITANNLNDETIEHAADLLATRVSQHLENTA